VPPATNSHDLCLPPQSYSGIQGVRPRTGRLATSNQYWQPWSVVQETSFRLHLGRLRGAGQARPFNPLYSRGVAISAQELVPFGTLRAAIKLKGIRHGYGSLSISVWSRKPHGPARGRSAYDPTTLIKNNRENTSGRYPVQETARVGAPPMSVMYMP
jgi:hypothetical protein